MENVSHGFILRLYDECQFNSNFKLYLSFESYLKRPRRLPVGPGHWQSVFSGSASMLEFKLWLKGRWE